MDFKGLSKLDRIICWFKNNFNFTFSRKGTVVIIVCGCGDTFCSHNWFIKVKNCIWIRLPFVKDDFFIQLTPLKVIRGHYLL